MKIIYWLSTLLFCIGMAAGGVMDLTLNPMAVKSLAELGYPSYLGYILGFWKLAGVVVLVIPGFPVLKEWAYAGFVFNLTGAAASHQFSGDPISKVGIPLMLLVVAMVSRYSRGGCRVLSVGSCNEKTPPQT